MSAKNTSAIKKMLAATIFCFSVYLLCSKGFHHFFHGVEKVNPISNKIEDFELSDLCFAFMHKEVDPDTNVIIIDCSDDNRDSIAEKISTIERTGAAVIGIDIGFEDVMDPTADTNLIDTINKYKDNIVLGVDVLMKDLSRPFYVKMFNANDGNGQHNFGVLPEERKHLTKRTFTPYIDSNRGRVDTLFAVAVYGLAFRNELPGHLSWQSNQAEVVNYRNSFPGTERYPNHTTVPKVQSGKIFLLGIRDSNTVHDKYYTPLNGHLGRSLPDMFGVEYHAQVISMLINKDLLKETPLKYMWVFLSCCLFMSVLVPIFHLHNYYHFLLEILIIVITPIYIAISYYLLENKHIKLEPMDHIIPIFVCGLLLHLYEPFLLFIRWVSNSVKKIKFRS